MRTAWACKEYNIVWNMIFNHNMSITIEELFFQTGGDFRFGRIVNITKKKDPTKICYKIEYDNQMHKSTRTTSFLCR